MSMIKHILWSGIWVEADNRFLQYLKSTGNIRQLNGVGLGLEVGSGLLPTYCNNIKKYIVCKEQDSKIRCYPKYPYFKRNKVFLSLPVSIVSIITSFITSLLSLHPQDSI